MDVDPVDAILIVLIVVSLLIVLWFFRDWLIAHNPMRGFCLLLFKRVNPASVVGFLLEGLICSPFT